MFRKATQQAALSTNMKPHAHLYQIPYAAHKTMKWRSVLRTAGWYDHKSTQKLSSTSNTNSGYYMVRQTI